MSAETRHALKIIREYLAGQNEAVQYCLEYMADLVSQSASGITGGIQAGNVPANDVVSDLGGEVFEVGAPPPNSPSGSLSLNLKNGHVLASWQVNGANIAVSGELRCVESMSAPSDRFLFVVDEPGSGFYVLSTTNI